MAWSISDLFPSWGDSGERPSDNFQYDGGDQVNEKHFDYLWDNVRALESEVRSALTDIDGDGDGVVDKADAGATGFTFDGGATIQGDLADGAGNVVWDDSEDHVPSQSIESANPPDFGYSTVDQSGTVRAGNAANATTVGMADGETMTVAWASFTSDAGEPLPSGVDLVVVTLDNAGGGTVQTTVLSGDGTTVYDDQGGTASDVGSYTNSSGGDQTVALMVDNGHFGTGSGSDEGVQLSATVTIN